MATVAGLAVILTASATDFERTMGAAARSVKSTEKEFERSARRMESIGRKWSYGFTAPIIAGLTAVSAAAIRWEDDFAGVRKTVDATENQFLQLNKSLRNMTKVIPVTHRDLAKMAETAGQLGIQVENIEDFTRTMAMLGTATNMAGDEAGTALAQLDNIMQSGQKHFDRYGATVVHLGNNLATTERHIVDFGLRIAAAGRIARLTEAQVLSIGGAFASVGVESEAGGTAVSKMLASMTEAVATGNQNLAWFAATSRMTSAEFVELWRNNAAEAFTRFVEGLGASGDQAFAILRNLGLADQRLIRGFLSAANAGDLLRRSINLGTTAWEKNVALVNEANERYKTGASRLIMLKNRFYNVAITIGNAFSPILESAMTKAENLSNGLQRLADWFEKLPAPVRVATGNILLFVAAVGPVTMAFALLNRTIAGALGVLAMFQSVAANAVFAFTAWKAGASTLIEAITYLVGGPVKLAIVAIGGLVVASIYLAANWEKVSAIATKVWYGIGAVILYVSSIVLRSVSYMVASIGGASQTIANMADSLRTSAVNALQVAKTTAAVAEQTENVASSAESATKAQNKLAEALEIANQAASGGIQSFDEVHQVQEQMSFADAMPVIPDISLPEIQTPAVSLTETVEKAGQTFIGLWDNLIDKFPVIQTGIQSIKDNWDTVGPAVEAAMGVILIIKAPFLAAAAAIAGAALLVITNWESIGPVFTSLWQGIESNVKPIWDRLKTYFVDRMGEIKETIMVILNYIYNLWDRWGVSLTAIVTGMMNNTKIVIDGVLRIISDLFYMFLAIIRGDWEAAWDNIRDIGMAIWESIGAIAENMWNTMVVVITNIWGNLKIVAETVWNGILSVTQTIWGSITDWLVDTWMGIYSLAEGLWNWISATIASALNSLTAVFKTVWSGVGGFLSDTWNGIAKTASKVWNGIYSTVAESFSAIIKTADKWAGNLISTVIDMNKQVVKYVQNMVNEVLRWITSLPSRAIKAVEDLVTGVIGRFQRLYDVLVGHSIVPDLANESVGWFDFLNKEGTEIVDQFGNNVTNSFSNTFNNAVTQATGFSGVMTTTMNNLSMNMQTSFSRAFDGILSGSMTFSQGLTSILGGMGDAIRNSLVQQLAQSATRSLSTLGSWVAGVVSQAAVAVAAMIKTAYATLLAFFAWSGPLAPALAAGVIAAGIIGIGKIAVDAIGAFKDVPGLAKGGIVTGPTFAQLGEGGRREVVIPLERDNVIADSVGQAVYQAMITAQRVGQASSSSQTHDSPEIVLRIDGTTFARAILPSIVRESQRQGLDLVARPQGV